MLDDVNVSATPELDPNPFPDNGEEGRKPDSPTDERGPTEGILGDEQDPEPPRPSHNEGNEEEVGAPYGTVSARKLEANRQNATRSTGPKTETGKARSSLNAIRHGIFAAKLLNQTPQGANERLEYEELATQVRDFYQPVGTKEQLLVELLITELVRTGRILRYEQMVLTSDSAFWSDGLAKVLRYSQAHSREVARLMKWLEEEQAKRRVK
jgi:hypothetical protein